MSHDFPFNAEAIGDGDNVVGCLWFTENLETVTEVIDAMHFAIGGAGSPLNFAEERWYGKEVVLHVLDTGAEA